MPPPGREAGVWQAWSAAAGEDSKHRPHASSWRSHKKLLPAQRRASQCGLTTSFNPDPLRQALQARSALVVASSQTGLATPVSAGRVNSNVKRHTQTAPHTRTFTIFSPKPHACSQAFIRFFLRSCSSH